MIVSVSDKRSEKRASDLVTKYAAQSQAEYLATAACVKSRKQMACLWIVKISRKTPVGYL